MPAACQRRVACLRAAVGQPQVLSWTCPPTSLDRTTFCALAADGWAPVRLSSGRFSTSVYSL
eukprot:6783199-Pyramimonas_sp.AAC.1